jgi:hypothetical protein
LETSVLGDGIILKWCLNEKVGGLELDLPVTGKSSIAGCCEFDNNFLEIYDVGKSPSAFQEQFCSM